MDIATILPPSEAQSIKKEAPRHGNSPNGPDTTAVCNRQSGDSGVEAHLELIAIREAVQVTEKRQRNEVDARNFPRAVGAAKEVGSQAVVPGRPKKPGLSISVQRSGDSVWERVDPLHRHHGLRDSGVKNVPRKEKAVTAEENTTNEIAEFKQQLKALPSIDGIIPEKVGTWLGAVEEKFFSTVPVNVKNFGTVRLQPQRSAHTKALRPVAAVLGQPANSRKTIEAPQSYESPRNLQSNATNANETISRTSQRPLRAILHQRILKRVKNPELPIRPIDEHTPLQTPRLPCLPSNADEFVAIPYEHNCHGPLPSTTETYTKNDFINTAILGPPSKTLTQKSEKVNENLKTSVLSTQQALARKVRTEEERLEQERREEERLEQARLAEEWQEQETKERATEMCRVVMRQWYCDERQVSQACHATDENTRHPSQMHLLDHTELALDYFMKGVGEGRQRHFELALRSLEGKIEWFNSVEDQRAYEDWQVAMRGIGEKI
jgi:hypothetical protein